MHLSCRAKGFRGERHGSGNDGEKDPWQKWRVGLQFKSKRERAYRSGRTLGGRTDMGVCTCAPTRGHKGQRGRPGSVRG